MRAFAETGKLEFHMTRIYLIRHGRAETGWDRDYDPGLDDLGRSQARAAANKLAPLGPLEVISSPLKRARQTAMPLAELWGCSIRTEKCFGEIPSPRSNLRERGRWLRDIMGEKWSDLGGDLQVWRRGVIKGLRALDTEAVVFSHFVAINVVIGASTGDDRVVGFWADNGSVTTVDVDGDRLSIVERGSEIYTKVG